MLRDLGEYKLQTLYLNVRRLTELAGDQAVASALNLFVNGVPSDKALANARLGACGRVLLKWLRQNGPKISCLEKLMTTGGARPGLVFTMERYFHCSNLAPRVRPSKNPSCIKTKLDTPSGEVDVLLHTHADHIAPGSPGAELSGKVSNLFVVATLTDVVGATLRGNAIFIGRRVAGANDVISVGDSLELHARDIDNFSKCAGETYPRDGEWQKVMRDLPEVEVKNAFAGMIGEDFVPKDWGGERSDLFSTRVMVGGRQLSTAFVFKGPAKFSPMTWAHLGKNGDQIDRLFSEPADLLVLQHCHRIHNSVRNMLRAYAGQVGSLRRYCVIDGPATLWILCAYGLCGQVSKPSPQAAEESHDEL